MKKRFFSDVYQKFIAVTGKTCYHRYRKVNGKTMFGFRLLYTSGQDLQAASENPESGSVRKER